MRSVTRPVDASVGIPFEIAEVLRHRLQRRIAGHALGRIPRGTHDWDRFLTSEELTTELEKAGLEVLDVTGLGWSPRDADRAVEQVAEDAGNAPDVGAMLRAALRSLGRS